MPDKVLVTGGTGFIGGHLVDALLKQGRRVRCLLNSESREEVPYKPGVEYVTGNLLDPGSLHRALANVSVVYHLDGDFIYHESICAIS